MSYNSDPRLSHFGAILARQTQPFFVRGNTPRHDELRKGEMCSGTESKLEKACGNWWVGYVLDIK